MFPIGKPEWVYESDPERPLGILVRFGLFVLIMGGLFLIGALG